MILKLLSYPRALVNLIFIPVFTLFCSALTIGVVVPFFSKKDFDRLSRFWAAVLCKVSGIHIHASGEAALQNSQAVILVSNHLGLFDIPVLFLTVPISFRMAAKAELFKIPLFGAALRGAGMLPIARNNPQEAHMALLGALEKFKRGESFWMAPEGTRFKGEGIGDFKLGAFHLSLQSQTPVVPICIYGTQHVLPKNTVLINWGTWRRDIFVHILPQVLPQNFSKDGRYELRDHVRGLIVQEFSKLQNLSNSFHGHKTQA
jgi:1-acyl-sn-glycerol-3-phosphate acyltransferase